MTKPTGEERRSALEDLLLGKEPDEQKALVEQAVQKALKRFTLLEKQVKTTEARLQVLRVEEKQVRQKLETLNRQIALEKGQAAARKKAEKVSASSPREDRLFGKAPFDMVYIEGGTFMMGSSANEPSRDSDEMQHQVTVNDFCMGKYPVTQKDYLALMRYNPSRFKENTLPVEQVNWYDAIDYCNARSKKEGLTPAYTVSEDNVTWSRDANGYRLPTEAEWEYACRAGTTTPFNTGDNITTYQANYNGNYPYNGNAKGTYRGKTTPVGSLTANAWGLYDMHANVWEWCWDWYGDYSNENQTDPLGAASGSYRVIRGGGWGSNAAYLRSASRSNNTPKDRYYGIGFRIVRS